MLNQFMGAKCSTHSKLKINTMTTQNLTITRPLKTVSKGLKKNDVLAFFSDVESKLSFMGDIWENAHKMLSPTQSIENASTIVLVRRGIFRSGWHYMGGCGRLMGTKGFLKDSEVDQMFMSINTVLYRYDDSSELKNITEEQLALGIKKAQEGQS